MEVRCRTSIAGMPKVEGYLEKRGGKFNFRCLWKKYWFVLDGRSLLYFKSKDSYESLGVCKGMIDFSRVQVIRIPAKIKHGFPFEIVTRSQVIYLSANESITRDIWIEELRHAIRPPQISDPFNTAKISAPHLSNLFEEVCNNPRGNSENKHSTTNENEIVSQLESLKFLQKNNIPEETAEKEKSMLFNEEDRIADVGTQYSMESLDEIDSDISTTKEASNEEISTIPLENILLSENTKNKQQIMEESDETDDTNYETAEETLESEIYFDEKKERWSYSLPYPTMPEYDLSAYCELKDFINNLDNKEVCPSINKLGKSVAVETMRNFLCEIEN